jgi:hypothetical protein
MKSGWLIVGVCIAYLLINSHLFADDRPKDRVVPIDTVLRPLPTNETEPIAAQYAGLIKSIPSPPFKFELDLPHSIVLRSNDSKTEVVFIPAAGQQLDAEDALLGQDRGAPVGWMLLKGLVPSVRSKLPGRQSFHLEGDEHQGTAAFQVSLRRPHSGILRLEWWGEGDGPVAATTLRPSDQTSVDKFELRYLSGLLCGSGIAKSLFFLPVEPVIGP